MGEPKVNADLSGLKTTMTTDWFAEHERARVAQVKAGLGADGPKAAHYNLGQFEVIDVMVDWFPPAWVLGFCYLNAFKYTARAHAKGGTADYKKAADHLAFATKIEAHYTAKGIAFGPVAGMSREAKSMRHALQLPESASEAEVLAGMLRLLHNQPRAVMCAWCGETIAVSDAIPLADRGAAVMQAAREHVGTCQKRTTTERERALEEALGMLLKERDAMVVTYCSEHPETRWPHHTTNWRGRQIICLGRGMPTPLIQSNTAAYARAVLDEGTPAS